MTTVPRFALYGTEQAPGWADLVHIERVPERSSRFDWEIAPHVHEGLLQLLFIVNASEGGEALMDEHRWPIQPPCLVIIPAGVVHGFRFRKDTDGPVITAAQRPLESLVASIAPEFLPHIRRAGVLRVDEDSRFADGLMPLFDAIAREYRYAASGHVAAGMSLLAALFVQIARISEEAAALTGDLRSRKAVQIERFRGLLDRHFRDHLPVEAYARELGMTAGHLGRLCRDVMGMSPLDAIHARVLHEAQRELVYSSLSIKQIAAAIGFEDEAYFGRFFRKGTGQKPTEFRRSAREHLARS